MPDETTEDELRIAHRRGHDKLMHVRAREDIARANVLVTENGAILEVGELFDGEMLVVDGDQIVSEPIPGGGGSVDVSDITGLGAGVEDWLVNPAAGNLRAAVGPASGTGELVFNTNTTLVTPNLGTPSAADLANATNLPASSVVWSGAALQSPVLGDDVMMIEQATGGAKRRVIAADVAKSAYAYYGFVLAPVTGIGSAPVNIFTTSTLPVGSYIMSFTAAFGVALSGGATSFTVDLAVASGTVSAIAGFAGKPGHTTTIGQQGSAGITSLPFALVTTFTNSNQNCLCVYSAVVTVSAPAVLTINVSLNTTSTGFVRAGSFLQFAR